MITKNMGQNILRFIYIMGMIFSILVYRWRLAFGRKVSLVQLKQEWAKFVLKILGIKIQIEGSPLKDGPLIIVGNHVSYLDILVLIAAAPEVVFVAKEEIKYWPIIGSSAKKLGTVFVNRERKKSEEARKIISHALKEKKAQIVVFPAGTTTLYEEKSWKKGMFYIAQELDIPVQLFRLDFSPLRESAYIDDDSLFMQIFKLLRIPSKTVRLTWIEAYRSIPDPVLFAEELRMKVRQFSPDFLFLDPQDQKMEVESKNISTSF